jgi:uncharacterized membrane protein
MSFPRATYTTILLGTIAWCAALFLAPILSASGPALRGTAVFLYSFFHPVCHQLDDRSFHVFGHPLAVCARCSAIYLAFLSGTILYPAIRRAWVPTRSVLAVSIVPMLADVLAGALGLHEISNLSRAITGALFGITLPLFVIPAAVEAMTQVLTSLAREHGMQPINHHL